MNPGDLNKRITIQTKTSVADGIGGFNDTVATFCETWAGIWPVSGKEIVSNQQLVGQVSHRVRIRYRSGVTSAMKILYGTRTFNISSVVDPNEAHEWLDLICLEVV